MSRIEIYRESRTEVGFRDGEYTDWPVFGDYRWRFVHTNGRIMADSAEGYKRKRDCLHGAAVVLGGRMLGVRAGNPDSLVGWVWRHRDDQIEIRDLTRGER